ncbi:hypothetical protein PPACK8108_LOCUS8672 [Phakopsora pachyrhizi]|uniref:Uncharacterized protein n=1 Tax=Phakopsora pachyrhizi TaxID=170000 RepID=A0AAV0AYE2_PHAPC|nr:hypothetical protein PPACK8108_LOCUS8672 [Phakopsora pachyrhizi]
MELMGHYHGYCLSTTKQTSNQIIWITLNHSSFLARSKKRDREQSIFAKCKSELSLKVVQDRIAEAYPNIDEKVSTSPEIHNYFGELLFAEKGDWRNLGLSKDQLVDRPEPGVQNLTGLQKMVFWLPMMFDICGMSLSNGQRCPPTIVGYSGSLKPKVAADVIIKLDEEAVGLEGIFGLLTTLVAIPILDLTIGSKPENRGGYFDLSSGFNQILSSSAFLWLSLAIAISIALFNFYGLAVTKTISALVRLAMVTTKSMGQMEELAIVAVVAVMAQNIKRMEVREELEDQDINNNKEEDQ